MLNSTGKKVGTRLNLQFQVLFDNFLFVFVKARFFFSKQKKQEENLNHKTIKNESRIEK